MTEETKRMHWMAWDIPAYWADTRAWNQSAELHGAYMMLLGAMWMNKGTLPPADDPELAVLACCTPDRWALIKDKILAKFDTVEGGLLTQNRLMREIGRAHKVSTARQEAGKRGAAAKWANLANASKEPSDLPKQNDRQKQKQKHSPNGEEDISSPFNEAWALYPMRAGGNSKAGALKAWNARIASGVDPAAMLSGTRRYAAFCVATGKVSTEFVKMAASFYGPQHHYLDAWALPAAPVNASRADQRVNTLNNLGTPYHGATHGTDRTEPIDVRARVIPDSE